MSEHPINGVGAPEPTTEMPFQAPPQQHPGESPAESPAEPPTRAFAGFRTERRVHGPGGREPLPPTAPAPGGMPPWDSTPVTGIPRMDPTAYGAYYNGPAEAPPARPGSDVSL